jgi:hypothetical protein
MSGAALIALERQRQITEELFTPGHDAVHTAGELTRAALCYTCAGWILASGGSPRAIENDGRIAILWPWHMALFKPADEAIRNLEKAGALLAAEIDRLKMAEAAAERWVMGIG